ncbi:MAG: hypothetical protein ACTHKS_06625 [Gaiellaceae bacterium]
MAKKNGEVALRLLEKFLMPIVATAASAAASYAAKKAPQVIGASHSSVPATNGHRRISADELGRRRDQRAQGRADRRKAVK